MKPTNKELYETLLNDKNKLNLEIYETLEKIVLGDEIDKICFTKDGKFICHSCGGIRTCKAGTNKQGKQKYKCHDCGKIMISQRNIITFSSKKDFSQWLIFLTSELDGNPLYVSAEKANISKRTAFRWRHKICYLLNSLLNRTCLEGIVYLDETLFPNIYKSPKIKEEILPKKRGISSQKINVTCAVDSSGNTIMKVLGSGRITSKELISAYQGKIEAGSIVVSDSLRSYHQLMEKLNICWEKIPSKKTSINDYTLEPVNHMHAAIKNFTYKYKGISKKYLQGYLALFDFQQKYKKHYLDEVFFEIIKLIFTASGTLKCSELDSGIAIYD